MVAIVSVYESGLIRAMQSDGQQWNKHTAEEVMFVAQDICPSGATGVLRNSHWVEQNRMRGGFTTGFNINNDARHALWVHNGTGIYGPRGMPIVPVNTEMLKYMHIPPWMLANPWIWTNLRGSGSKKVSPLGADIDPWAHAEEVDGMRGFPWLRIAGESVAGGHGA